MASCQGCVIDLMNCRKATKLDAMELDVTELDLMELGQTDLDVVDMESIDLCNLAILSLSSLLSYHTASCNAIRKGFKS